jgi:hypothetical protein
MQPAMGAEKQKMLAGLLYDPSDPQLSSERQRARTLCHALNALDPAEAATQRQALLVDLRWRSATTYGLEAGS